MQSQVDFLHDKNILERFKFPQNEFEIVLIYFIMYFLRRDFLDKNTKNVNDTMFLYLTDTLMQNHIFSPFYRKSLDETSQYEIIKMTIYSYLRGDNFKYKSFKDYFKDDPIIKKQIEESLNAYAIMFHNFITK